MRLAFAIFVALHALIHLLGFLKAFELARALPLTIPISRAMGLMWLAAAALYFAAAVSLLASTRSFWFLVLFGALVSQVAIVASWSDARYGTAANVIALLAALYGAFTWGPFGLRAEYERRTADRLADLPDSTLVTDDELMPLPAPVQRYLRYVGVVGHPHPRAFRVRFTGRIRSGPDAPWMPLKGEQHNFIDPPTRLFWMQATMHGLPVEGLHSYDENGARMRVKLLSFVPVVDVAGAPFTRTETVTLLNDMCVMAPATLLNPAIRWRQLDSRSVEATYTNGPHTIRAVLLFNETGALVNFWSDDRPSLAPDGVTFVAQRWSTPLGPYRARGAFTLASRGEARYASPTGEYTYIEFDGLDVTYDPSSP